MEGGRDGVDVVEVTVLVQDRDGNLHARLKRKAELVYEDGRLSKWEFLEPVHVSRGFSFKVVIPDVTRELEHLLRESGQLPGVSMGCRVPQMQCLVCGSVGDEPCDHLKAPVRATDAPDYKPDRYSISCDFAPPADRMAAKKVRDE